MRRQALKNGSTPPIDWDDVRHVLAIARAGSLSRAADDLGVDHATLSRRAARIERALGAKLFDRSAAGVTPTAAGDALVKVAQEAEEKMQSIERQLRGTDTDVSHVRLATSSVLSTALLSSHLGEFSKRHPDVVLKLSLASGSSPPGGADVSLSIVPPEVLSAPSPTPPVVLGVVGWAAYVAEGGPVESAIHYSATRQPGRAWLDQHVGPDIVAFADDVPAACVLVEAGCGVAVLPCFYADGSPRLRQLSPVLEEHRLVARVPDELRHVGRVRVVVEWLRRAALRDAKRLVGAPPSSPTQTGRRRRGEG